MLTINKNSSTKINFKCMLLGPFCGNAKRLTPRFISTSNAMMVVFYSDTMGSYRQNGILRMMATVAGN